VKPGEQDQRVLFGDGVELLAGGEPLFRDLVREIVGASSDDPAAGGSVGGFGGERLSDLGEARERRSVAGDRCRGAQAAPGARDR
jgi:hypothetical protein